MRKADDIKKTIAEMQREIKLRLFEYGARTRLSKKTGLSAYKINQTISSDNPDLELLEKIEKALSGKSKRQLAWNSRFTN